MSEQSLLDCLSKLKRPVSAKRLTLTVGQGSSSISRCLRNLMEENLVERIRHPPDRHLFYQLTEEGRKRLTTK